MMHYPKTRDEWLALRGKYVSSTESSALFGLSKYLTAYELAVTKRDGLGQEDQNERSKWGIALQFAIAQACAHEQQIKVRRMSAYADGGDQLGASFDYEIVGAVGDSEICALYRQHGPGVLEVKNVDGFIYRNEWTEDEAPAHIEIQVQHQLEACERAWALLAVLIGGNRLRVLIRMRDLEVGAAIRAKVREFWRNLAAGVLPPVTLPEDAAIIAQVYGHAEPGSVLQAADDARILEYCAQYAAAMQAESGAKKAKESARAQLLQLIGTAEKVLAGEYTISAGVIGECVIDAYTRKSYRNFRITQKASHGKKSAAA